MCATSLTWKQPEALRPRSAPLDLTGLLLRWIPRLLIAVWVGDLAWEGYHFSHGDEQALFRVPMLLGWLGLWLWVARYRIPVYWLNRFGIGQQDGIRRKFYGWQDIEYYEISPYPLAPDVLTLVVKAKPGRRWHNGVLYFDAESVQAPQLLALLKERLPNADEL